MNDITFCSGKDCILKQKCYRFTAKVFGRKNIFSRIPFNKETNYCKYFEPNHKQIEITAYFLWKNDGCKTNKSEYYWLEAEKIIY